MTSSVSIGLVVCSHADSTLATATFDNVSIVPGAAWSSRDIGAPQVAGFSTYSGGVLTLNASGSDIWNPSDQFRTVYQPASGDCEITARLTGVTNTDLSAKMGVMVRETLAADSAHASVFVTPGSGIAFQQRIASGGASTQVAQSAGLTAPCWVRVRRVGNVFTAYTSPDGSAWSTLGSTTLSIGSSSYIGIAMTSHNPTLLGTGVADNIMAIPWLPVARPVARLLAIGNPTTFSVVPFGTGPFSLQWQRLPSGGSVWSALADGTDYSGSKTATLTVAAPTAAMLGDQFRCLATGPSGTLTGSPGKLVTAPVINTPGTKIVSATSKAGAVVSYGVSATDSVDGTLTAICTPPSGSPFPIGSSTVNCSVFTSWGGYSSSSFTVTVLRSLNSFLDQYGMTNSDPLADPNRTGVSALAAYAFGVNPLAPDRTQLPAITVVGGYLQISYPRWKSASDLAYLVEVSSDLQKWDSGPAFTQTVLTTAIDSTRERVVERDLTAFTTTARRFIRIRLVRQ